MELDIGRGISVRLYIEDDAPEVLPLINDPLVWRRNLLAQPLPYSEEDIRKELKDGQGKNFAIIYEGKLAGMVAVEEINDSTDWVEVGVWLGRAYWGKGIAEQVARWFPHYIFTYLPKVDKVYARVFKTNRPMAKILREAGWRLDTLLENDCIKNGKPVNRLLYSYVRGIHRETK